ncbi:MAG: hypothetical protein K2X94_00890 [Amoebophilaceae bacterium]|nr:hypothetical protein [Amoebophilaceae bacterium]
MIFTKLMPLDEQMKDFGFYWENVSDILKQIDNKCQAVFAEFLAKKQLREELGDLLYLIVSCAFFLKLDICNESEIYVSQFDRKNPPAGPVSFRGSTALLDEIVNDADVIEKKFRTDLTYCRKVLLEMVCTACKLINELGFKCIDVLSRSFGRFKKRMLKLIALVQEKKLDDLNSMSMQDKTSLWMEAGLMVA